MKKYQMTKEEGRQLVMSFNYTGEQLKQAGIELAKENSEKKTPGWHQIIFDALKKYLKAHPPAHEFRCEQFRKWCEEYGYPEPSHKRAFGTIMTMAIKSGLITRLQELDYSSDPRSHMARCFRYKKLKV